MSASVQPQEPKTASRHEESTTPAVRTNTELVKTTVSQESRKRRRDRRSLIAMRVAAVIGILLAWELASGPLVNPVFASSPSAIFGELVEGFTERNLLWHAQVTALEAILGFVIGSSVAIALALFLVTLPRVYAVIEPIVLAVYGIPKIALAPLFIVWFGLGITSKVAIAGFMVFFIVFMSTIAALSRTNPRVVQIARMMGASHGELLWKVRLPAAAPYILTALKIVVPTAMIGAVVGEFISSQRGLGFWITRATLSFNTASAFAGIIVLMTLVLVLNAIVSFADRRLLPWRTDREDR